MKRAARNAAVVARIAIQESIPGSSTTAPTSSSKATTAPALSKTSKAKDPASTIPKKTTVSKPPAKAAAVKLPKVAVSKSPAKAAAVKLPKVAVSKPAKAAAVKLPKVAVSKPVNAAGSKSPAKIAVSKLPARTTVPKPPAKATATVSKSPAKVTVPKPRKMLSSKAPAKVLPPKRPAKAAISKQEANVAASEPTTSSTDSVPPAKKPKTSSDKSDLLEASENAATPASSCFPVANMPKTVDYPKEAGSKLGRIFYDQPCIQLCKSLLGTVLCRRIQDTGEILRGTIVETEAYPGGDDQASNSYKGKRTPRNESVFLDPGTAYVYFTYGMYFCFNISSKGEGSACLIRAVEPLENYETMHAFRAPKKADGTQEDKPKKRRSIHELANGPSKLCIAFEMRRDNCDKLDMTTSDELWLEQSRDLKFLNREFEMEVGKRIGIESTPPAARDRLWRFFVKDSWAESRAKIGELKKKAKLNNGE